jgi:hypothetical protein
VWQANSQQGRELADYSHVNFFGNIFPDPYDEAGRFITIASTVYGKGRVTLFTDSTILSDFALFYYDLPSLVINIIEETSRGVIPIILLIFIRLIQIAALVLLTIVSIKGFRRTTDSIIKRSLLAMIPFWVNLGFLAGGFCTTLATSLIISQPKPHTQVTKIAFIEERSAYRIPTMLNNIPNQEVDRRSFDNFFLNCQRMGFQPLMVKDLAEGITKSKIVVLINPNPPLDSNLSQKLKEWCKTGGIALVLLDEKCRQYILKNTNEEISVTLQTHDSNIIEALVHNFGEGKLIYVINGVFFNRINLGRATQKPTKLQLENNLLQFELFKKLNIYPTFRR